MHDLMVFSKPSRPINAKRKENSTIHSEMVIAFTDILTKLSMKISENNTLLVTHLTKNNVLKTFIISNGNTVPNAVQYTKPGFF